MRRAKGTKQLKCRRKPDECYQLKHHSWLTCLLLFQDSEELLGHHLYDEFRPSFGLFFSSFLSSPNRSIYVFCSPSWHYSPFSAYTGSPCSPYSLEIFITHNCNWLSKSKHSGLVSQPFNYGVINRKNLIKTFPSEMYSHGIYGGWSPSHLFFNITFTHLNHSQQWDHSQ